MATVVRFLLQYSMLNHSTLEGQQANIRMKHSRYIVLGQIPPSITRNICGGMPEACCRSQHPLSSIHNLSVTKTFAVIAVASACPLLHSF